MALRVLLADESSTIKKVVQLTLQDFDVDVRSVSVGLDVLSVAKTFRPDIVMADVLLAKRSGYEVCHDLKNDSETSSIPVVLMWSGFMEIDEQKARLSGADRRLEKPFDAETLRKMVRELVSKTETNPVSAYLQFPPLPEFKETPPPKQASAAPAPQPPQAAAPAPVQHATNDSPDSLLLDDGETDGQDEWIQKPPAARPAPQNPATMPPQTPKVPPPQPQEEFSEFPLNTVPKKMAQSVAPQASAQLGVSEEIMRQEIQKWLNANMTSLAERIIRDEINRLLQDSEQSIEGP